MRFVERILRKCVFKKILLHNFFFYMFDLQLNYCPPLCPACALKQSLLTFFKLMTGINKSDETL